MLKAVIGIFLFRKCIHDGFLKGSPPIAPIAAVTPQRGWPCGGARSMSGEREKAPENYGLQETSVLFHRLCRDGKTTASRHVDFDFGLAGNRLFIDVVALRIVDIICIFPVFIYRYLILFAFVKK